MLEEQQNVYDKLATTLSYLDSNQDIWSSVPIVKTYRDHLADSVNDLKEELSEQPEKLNFGSGTLHQLRITIAEKMDILDDILEAYAEDVADKSLLEVAKNSKTDYLRLTNDGFERKVVNVLKLLEDFQDTLRNYGLSQEQISDVNEDFEAFKSKRNDPQPVQESQEASPQIKLLLEEATHTCERLTKIMVRFRTSNGRFYQGFMAIDEIDSKNLAD